VIGETRGREDLEAEETRVRRSGGNGPDISSVLPGRAKPICRDGEESVRD
jgi:hypothetical protein